MATWLHILRGWKPYFPSTPVFFSLPDLEVGSSHPFLAVSVSPCDTVSQDARIPGKPETVSGSAGCSAAYHLASVGLTVTVQGESHDSLPHELTVGVLRHVMGKKNDFWTSPGVAEILDEVQRNDAVFLTCSRLMMVECTETDRERERERETDTDRKCSHMFALLTTVFRSETVLRTCLNMS